MLDLLLIQIQAREDTKLNQLPRSSPETHEDTYCKYMWELKEQVKILLLITAAAFYPISFQPADIMVLSLRC